MALSLDFCATWDTQSHWLDGGRGLLTVISRYLMTFFSQDRGKVGPPRTERLPKFLPREPLQMADKRTWVGAGCTFDPPGCPRMARGTVGSNFLLLQDCITPRAAAGFPEAHAHRGRGGFRA